MEKIITFTPPSSAVPNTPSVTSCATSCAKSCAASFTCSSYTCCQRVDLARPTPKCAEDMNISISGADPPPLSGGGLDLNSSNSGCARLGSGVAPPSRGVSRRSGHPGRPRPSASPHRWRRGGADFSDCSMAVYFLSDMNKQTFLCLYSTSLCVVSHVARS